MKKLFFFLCLLLLVSQVVLNAQTTPYVSPADIANRNYYINLPIFNRSGAVKSSDGVEPEKPDYLLLHKVPTTRNFETDGKTIIGSNFESGHVMGKITGIRGNGELSNRAWTMEVNTSSNYNSTTGSVIGYNESGNAVGKIISGRLVTITIRDDDFIALEIPTNFALRDFSFTGYANNQIFRILTFDEIREMEGQINSFPRLFDNPNAPETPKDRIDAVTVHGSSIVSNKERDYYINLDIHNEFEKQNPTTFNDVQDGFNDYILLHGKNISKDNTAGDFYLQGRITGIAATGGDYNRISWNRKWSVEINTGSYRASTRGSIISYNESTANNGALVSGRLVTVIYQGKPYLALEIPSRFGLQGLSFTGYAKNYRLTVVNSEQIEKSSGSILPFPKTRESEEEPEEYLDPVTVHGPVNTRYLVVNEGATIHTSQNKDGKISSIKVLPAENLGREVSGVGLKAVVHDSTDFGQRGEELQSLQIESKELILNLNGAPVGINIRPSANLHTSGTVRFDNINGGGDAPGDLYYRSASGNLDRLSLVADTNMILSVGAGVPIWKKPDYSSIDASKWVLSGSRIYNKNSGYVGVGTSNPLTKMHINNGNKYGGLLIQNKNGNNWIADTVNGYNYLRGTTLLADSGVGNVGIGTSNPLAKLHIDNGNQKGGLYINNSNGNNWIGNSSDGKNYLRGTTILADSLGGNVGVGITIPLTKMHINNGNNNGGLLIQNSNGNNWIGSTSNGYNYLRGTTVLADNGGSVGIGTVQLNDTAYKLFVENGIRTRKVKVDVDAWPDYVFEQPIQLSLLDTIARFIAQNKHLPNMPSAKEVAKEGIELGTNQAALLKKIEELTLLMIEQQKMILSQQQQIDGLKHGLNQLQHKE